MLCLHGVRDRSHPVGVLPVIGVLRAPAPTLSTLLVPARSGGLPRRCGTHPCRRADRRPRRIGDGYGVDPRLCTVYHVLNTECCVLDHDRVKGDDMETAA